MTKRENELKKVIRQLNVKIFAAFDEGNFQERNRLAAQKAEAIDELLALDDQKEEQKMTKKENENALIDLANGIVERNTERGNYLTPEELFEALETKINRRLMIGEKIAVKQQVFQDW